MLTTVNPGITREWRVFTRVHKTGHNCLQQQVCSQCNFINGNGYEKQKYVSGLRLRKRQRW